MTENETKVKSIAANPVSRRGVLKGGAAAAAGLALAHPKASKVFAIGPSVRLPR